LINEEDAAMPLAGGIMQYGHQCGMIWGAALAAGAQAYRRLGPGPGAETNAVIASQRLVESFYALNSNINCRDITGLDKSSSAWRMLYYFLGKGGTLRCFNRAVTYAKASFKSIDTSLSEKNFEAPSPPVSCAAMVAKKMGASEMHAVMAAGLAGGIGLTGGACGALGAALWIRGINSLDLEGAKIEYQSPENEEVIDRFLKCTNSKFKCSRIAGRKFGDICDHASYLSSGGCSEIIEVLAAQ
jgi:hypothetical protein